TPGATIYYTTDGSTPTTAASVYAGPISVTRTTTLRAMAAAPGMANSAVTSATYTLQTATPTFNPSGGTYVLPQLVSISDATPGMFPPGPRILVPTPDAANDVWVDLQRQGRRS